MTESTCQSSLPKTKPETVKNTAAATLTNKTQATRNDVSHFIDTIESPQRKLDAQRLLNIFDEITQLPAVLWGTSIVGYGQYHYKYDSGREGDFFMVGFSPRKQNMVIYIMPGFEVVQNLLNTLGKHKIGKSCLYINKLSDVDEKTLKALICTSFKHMKLKHSLIQTTD